MRVIVQFSKYPKYSMTKFAMAVLIGVYIDDNTVNCYGTFSADGQSNANNLLGMYE